MWRTKCFDAGTVVEHCLPIVLGLIRSRTPVDAGARRFHRAAATYDKAFGNGGISADLHGPPRSGHADRHRVLTRAHRRQSQVAYLQLAFSHSIVEAPVRQSPFSSAARCPFQKTEAYEHRQTGLEGQATIQE